MNESDERAVDQDFFSGDSKDDTGCRSGFGKADLMKAGVINKGTELNIISQRGGIGVAEVFRAVVFRSFLRCQALVIQPFQFDTYYII